MEHNARVAERRRVMTIYLGKVSCDLHTYASRIRVQIDGTDGISLSVKASLNDFPRHLFKKDLVVEVEQCKQDGRRFRVTQVFAVVKKPIAVECNFHVRTPDAETSRKEQVNITPSSYTGRAMSHDRVRFYLNSKYFDHPELGGVLSRVFNFRPGEFSGIRHQGTGVRFICTTDQFARFLIERNLNGIKNGFMDLGAKLIRSTPPPDAYDLLAKAVGITRDQAKRVALALCYGSPSEIMERIKTDPHTPRDYAREIDVSDR